MVFYAIGVLSIMPWSSMLESIQFNRASPFSDWTIYFTCAATAVSGVVGWAGAICLASELFDFPEWGRRHAAQNKAKASAGVGYVRPEIICFWTLLLVGAAALVVYHENTRLLRFSRRIADTTRIVAVEENSRGVIGTGSDLRNLVKEVSMASRNTVTHRNPWCFRYAVDFFNEDTFLGTIYSDGQWFWINDAERSIPRHYAYAYWLTRSHGQYRFNDGSMAAEVFRVAHERFLKDYAGASK
jgi:hypothetical protein